LEAQNQSMAKLVVLSEGMTGQSYELKVDKTTVGRVDDNTFALPHASVSSHHCEILLRGNDVVIKDLNSTNGTFINNQQITTEGVLKPGQILRLGQIELRLETAAGPVAGRKPVDSTMVISKGVSLEQLEQGPQGFDTSKGAFSKKKNSTNKWIFIGAGVLLVVIVIAILVAYNQLSNHPGH
jgi:pSer/pThr/pTyr-binding forkhead associated (FHA) protein